MVHVDRERRPARFHPHRFDGGAVDGDGPGRRERTLQRLRSRAFRNDAVAFDSQVVGPRHPARRRADCEGAMGVWRHGAGRRPGQPLRHVAGGRSVHREPRRPGAQIGDAHVLGEDEIVEPLAKPIRHAAVDVQQQAVGLGEDVHVRGHAPLRRQTGRIAAGPRRQGDDVVGQESLQEVGAVLAGDRDPAAVLRCEEARAGA